jgi:hypothetical protein
MCLDTVNGSWQKNRVQVSDSVALVAESWISNRPCNLRPTLAAPVTLLPGEAIAEPWQTRATARWALFPLSRPGAGGLPTLAGPWQGCGEAAAGPCGCLGVAMALL